MTTFQKIVKYLAIAFAIFLTVNIIGGILSIFGVLGSIFDGDNVEKDFKNYSVSSDISSLDIEIGAADFTVKQGDSFAVESNLKHLTVKENDGILTIREKGGFGGGKKHAALILYIPEETVFIKADISTGAGRLTCDSLSADSVKLELGAGEVNIGSLSAYKRADIDGGAGKLTIGGGSLENLDLDMGVGQLNLTAAISGSSELDLGIGETNLNLTGSKDDYLIEIDKGIGNITVNNENLSGSGSIGSGDNRISIDGGIGSINIIFTGEE